MTPILQDLFQRTDFLRAPTPCSYIFNFPEERPTEVFNLVNTRRKQNLIVSLISIQSTGITFLPATLR